MQSKTIYIAAIISVLSILFVLSRLIKTSAPEGQSRTATTYIPGNTQQLYKQGKDSILTSTKSFHQKVVLHPTAEDSSCSFTSSDTSYKLSLNIQPAADSNFTLEYFLDLTTKNLVRIDTLFLTRIDTLKITRTITERIDPPFYNTFLFGAIVATAAILLILNFIP